MRQGPNGNQAAPILEEEARRPRFRLSLAHQRCVRPTSTALHAHRALSPDRRDPTAPRSQQPPSSSSPTTPPPAHPAGPPRSSRATRTSSSDPPSHTFATQYRPAAMPTPVDAQARPPAPRETMSRERERAQGTFDLERLTYAMGGGEAGKLLVSGTLGRCWEGYRAARSRARLKPRRVRAAVVRRAAEQMPTQRAPPGAVSAVHPWVEQGRPACARRTRTAGRRPRAPPRRGLLPRTLLSSSSPAQRL